MGHLSRIEWHVLVETGWHELKILSNGKLSASKNSSHPKVKFGANLPQSARIALNMGKLLKSSRICAHMSFPRPSAFHPRLREVYSAKPPD
ncbi:hypothetical protein ACTYEO_09750 [Rhodophyticola sp. SM2404]